jgi:hypothetical protein
MTRLDPLDAPGLSMSTRASSVLKRHQEQLPGWIRGQREQAPIGVRRRRMGRAEEAQARADSELIRA